MYQSYLIQFTPLKIIIIQINILNLKKNIQELNLINILWVIFYMVIKLIKLVNSFHILKKSLY